MTLSVNQVNHKQTPEKFYLLDETKHTYTLTHKDISDRFTSGKALQKLCVNGTQDLHVYDDITKLFHNDVLVCDYKVYLEELIEEKWVKYDFGKTKPVTKDTGKLGAEKEDPPASFNIICDWRGGDPRTERSSKIIFNLAHTGYIIRGKWYLRCYDREYITEDEEQRTLLQLNYTDFEGDSKDTGWRDSGQGYYERTIIFEPTGVKDKLIVDPYLSIDEQSNHIDVTCDGYIMRIYYASENASRIMKLDGSTNLLYLETGTMPDSDGANYMRLDTARIATVKTNTPTEVVIESVGNLARSGPVYMTNSKSFKHTWYIYSDRFAWEQVWQTETGDITLTSSGGIMRFEGTGLTNADYIYEEAGEEKDSSTGSTGTKTGDYIGIKSDEVNVQLINLDHSEVGATFFENIYNSTNIRNGYTAASAIGVGTHRISSFAIIDSAERSYGSKLYTSADRLAMGKQYKDLVI